VIKHGFDIFMVIDAGEMSGRKLFVAIVAASVTAYFTVLIINYRFYRKSDAIFLIKFDGQS
jgi:hypothetical protein